MSDYINKLESMKKQNKGTKQERKITSPGPNQITKLKQENRELKKKYSNLKHHELSEDNIMSYFMKIKKTKLYELARFFDLNAAHEIETLLKKLLREKKVFRGKNNWFNINPKYKKSLGGS